jgi:ribonuclease VapC
VIAVDTSALLAIIQKEPECERFLQLIRAADRVFVCSVSVLEAGMVLHSRRGVDGTDDLFDLIDGMGIDIVPFDTHLTSAAIDAFARYGKGVHAAARLNLCDCAAYALAKGMNAPLLFKGNDFTATDIAAAA